MRDENSSRVPPRLTSHHEERSASMRVRLTTDPAVQSSSLSREGRSSAYSQDHLHGNLSTESDHLRYSSILQSFSGGFGTLGIEPFVKLSSKGKSGEPYTPEYLKRAYVSVEEAPQHQDFASKLL